MADLTAHPAFTAGTGAYEDIAGICCKVWAITTSSKAVGVCGGCTIYFYSLYYSTLDISGVGGGFGGVGEGGVTIRIAKLLLEG